LDEEINENEKLKQIIEKFEERIEISN